MVFSFALQNWGFAITGNSFLDVILAGAVLSIAYALALGIYRLYFSPLAQFPGPKLAALTQWYEAYYDVYLDGKFLLHFKELHEKYGPIVRINPWEVHINDPEFYETIYSTSSAFDRVPQHVAWPNVPGASVATVSHSLHKIRRAAVGPLFSKRQVAIFAPEIQARADRLVNRFNHEYKSTGRVLCISEAYGCFSADIVTEFAFARGYDYLDHPEFKATFVYMVARVVDMMHTLFHFPILRTLLKKLPESWVEKVNPKMAVIFAFRRDIEKQIRDIMDGKNQAHKDASHPTVFKELLDSDLPPEEKTLERLRDEGFAMVNAGIETTRWTLSVATFHLLDKPHMLQTLKAEIWKAWPDINTTPSLQELERLPYLTAIIQETIRLNYGVALRLPRTSTSPLQYKSYTIPPGVAFSMSTYYMAHSETVFPSSHTFDPSRWLPDPVTGAPALGPDGQKLLTRYLASFSRGTRACLGIHVAYAELYIALATVVRKCEFRLYETTERDVRMWSEKFVAQAHPDSKGVRVLVV